jgi:aspartyl/glutamyl-tRNA(Asn/Gln) amidotransferase C subunit
MPSPSIDRALMQHLAGLARLHLAADRLPVLRDRLERIVTAFAALGDAVAAPAAPTASPAAPAVAPEAPPLALRADVAAAPLPVDVVLANAPQHAGGAFVVPRVIDG